MTSDAARARSGRAAPRESSARALRGILASWLFALGVGACAMDMSPTGDETHFQACKVDADCARLGGAYTCSSGKCRDQSGSSGGQTGQGGSSGRSSGGQGTSGAAAVCELIDQTSGDVPDADVQRLLGAAAASCALRASDYDQSCSVDADCVEVGVGNVCTTPCGVLCASDAIAARAMPMYEADLQASPVYSCVVGSLCGCPCIDFPRCVRGTCTLRSCGADVVDSGVMDSRIADGGPAR